MRIRADPEHWYSLESTVLLSLFAGSGSGTIIPETDPDQDKSSGSSGSGSTTLIQSINQKVN